MAEYKYIAVDGLVRSGKSRLAKKIGEKLNARLILDSTENPFLPDFFHDLAHKESNYFLKTQLIYLLNRYEQQLQIKQKGLFQKKTVSDYLFFRDGIYAHYLLNDEDLKIYKKIFRLLSESVCAPDLVVYLQISFAEMMRRIRDLCSEAEKSAPRDYWREIFEAYNYFFFNYNTAPLLVVNMEKTDLDDEGVIDNLLQEINTHKVGTRYYAPR